MRATVTVRGRFSASHLVVDHPTCGKPHGHTFDVAVTTEGPVRPLGAGEPWDISLGLLRLCAQLDHRDINAMLPGVVPIPEGIASWVREQLLLSFPTIVTVEVSIEDYSARLEWPLR